LKREVLIASLQRLTGRTPAQEEGKEPEIEGGRKRVLIVDDQAAARYVLAKLIDGKRYLVRQAKNGAEGLRMAKEVAPDFIFLDLDMPDIWGFDVLKALKADPVTESIPVAIVTSLSLSDEDRARVECQACAVISKSELSRARIDQLLTSTLTDSLKRTVEFAH
jgi:CheY-like chemotaxis protein